MIEAVYSVFILSQPLYDHFTHNMDDITLKDYLQKPNQTSMHQRPVAVLVFAVRHVCVSLLKTQKHTERSPSMCWITLWLTEAELTTSCLRLSAKHSWLN